MANFVSGIIAIVLAVVLVASLFMPTVKTANTTDWSSGEIAMWSVVGLIAIVGLVYGTATIFGIAG